VVPAAFPSLYRMSTHHLTIYLSVVVNNVSHSVSSLPIRYDRVRGHYRYDLSDSIEASIVREFSELHRMGNNGLIDCEVVQHARIY